MPYCSIEEAWGNNFFENKSQPKKFKKIVPDYIETNIDDIGYREVDYPDSNIYNSDGEDIYKSTRKKKKMIPPHKKRDPIRKKVFDTYRTNRKTYLPAFWTQSNAFSRTSESLAAGVLLGSLFALVTAAAFVGFAKSL